MAPRRRRRAALAPAPSTDGVKRGWLVCTRERRLSPHLRFQAAPLLLPGIGGRYPPMLPVFADPKTDFVFKRIFGAEAQKPLLIALLNHLLELEGDRCIQDVQHLSSEQRV